MLQLLLHNRLFMWLLHSRRGRRAGRSDMMIRLDGWRIRCTNASISYAKEHLNACECSNPQPTAPVPEQKGISMNNGIRDHGQTFEDVASWRHLRRDTGLFREQESTNQEKRQHLTPARAKTAEPETRIGLRNKAFSASRRTASSHSTQPSSPSHGSSRAYFRESKHNSALKRCVG